MKIVFVLLLYVSATAAINEWLGVPEGKLQQLGQLLDGLYLILFVFCISEWICEREISRIGLSRSLTLAFEGSRLPSVHSYFSISMCKFDLFNPLR